VWDFSIVPPDMLASVCSFHLPDDILRVLRIDKFAHPGNGITLIIYI